MLRKLRTFSRMLIFAALAVAAVHAQAAPNDTLAEDVDVRPATKTQVYFVEGLPGDLAASSLRQRLCGDRAYPSCYLAFVDPDEKLGELRIRPRPGQIVDVARLKDLVKTEGYKLTR